MVKKNKFNNKTMRNSEYKKMITSAADSRSYSIWGNSGPAHARIIMTNIFRTAQHSICIFAGNLNGAISTKEYIDELTKCLVEKGEERKVYRYGYGKWGRLFGLFNRNYYQGKGLAIKVIFESAPSSDSQAYKLLKEFQQLYPERITLRKLDASENAVWKENRKLLLKQFGHTLHHFTIADGRMYREEYDTERYLAGASFNNEGKVKQLNHLFHSLKTVEIN
jgi:hypothetical protein